MKKSRVFEVQAGNHFDSIHTNEIFHSVLAIVLFIYERNEGISDPVPLP